MTIWIDAQLSPSLADWITDVFAIPAHAVRDLGLREARDSRIFFAAREAGAIVLTKDVDFVHLLSRHGPPPKVLWLTCGNSSNQNLRLILASTLQQALELLNAGETLVEITGTESTRASNLQE